eukprot:446408_1
MSMLTIILKNEELKQLEIPQKSLTIMDNSSNLSSIERWKNLTKYGCIYIEDDDIIKHSSDVSHNLHSIYKKYDFIDRNKRDICQPLNSNLNRICLGTKGVSEPQSLYFFVNEYQEEEKNNGSNKVKFTELSDGDKQQISEWFQTETDSQNLQKDLINIVTELLPNKNNNNHINKWTTERINPLWFRAQSIGTAAHADLPYLSIHTNLFIDFETEKLRWAGAKFCETKFNNCNNDDCPIQESNLSLPCDACFQDNWGVVSTWTALDKYDFPWNSGSIIFDLKSHKNYSTWRESIIKNKLLPFEFGMNTVPTKFSYIPNIPIGGTFIFFEKMVHAECKSTDEVLRRRMDMTMVFTVNDEDSDSSTDQDNDINTNSSTDVENDHDINMNTNTNTNTNMNHFIEIQSTQNIVSSDNENRKRPLKELSSEASVPVNKKQKINVLNENNINVQPIKSIKAETKIKRTNIIELSKQSDEFILDNADNVLQNIANSMIEYQSQLSTLNNTFSSNFQRYQIDLNNSISIIQDRYKLLKEKECKTNEQLQKLKTFQKQIQKKLGSVMNMVDT